MAEKIVRGLQTLNAFLAQEVAQAKEEDKERKINESFQSATERFKQLGPDASESDIQSALYDTISEASKLGVGEQIIPLASNLYAEEVRQFEKLEVKEQDRLLSEAITREFGGAGLPENLSGAGRSALLQTIAQMTQQVQATDAEGRVTLRTLRPQFDGTYKMINEQVINSQTNRDRLNDEKELIKYRADQDLRVKAADVDVQKMTTEVGNLPTRVVGGNIQVNQNGVWVPYNSAIHGGLFSPGTVGGTFGSNIRLAKLQEEVSGNTLKAAANNLITIIREGDFQWDQEQDIKVSGNDPAAIARNLTSTYTEKQLREMAIKAAKGSDEEKKAAADKLVNALKDYKAAEVYYNQTYTQLQDLNNSTWESNTNTNQSQAAPQEQKPQKEVDTESPVISYLQSIPKGSVKATQLADVLGTLSGEPVMPEDDFIDVYNKLSEADKKKFDDLVTTLTVKK